MKEEKRNKMKQRPSIMIFNKRKLRRKPGYWKKKSRLREWKRKD
jgi:hypothetical protein